MRNSLILVKRFHCRSSLSVVCDDDFDIELAGDAEASFSPTLSGSYTASFRHKPFFFEQQRYEIIIEPLEGHQVTFWHENYYVRNKVSPVGKNHQLLTGVINFGNDIGLSDLTLLVDGNQYLKITIEVFPSKIDYQKDYLAIISDVTQEIYNLVFDFLKKTYESFDISSARQSSPVEFFAIIQQIYHEFISAADIILRSPHHQLCREAEILASHKIHQYDQRTIKWIEKHPEQVKKNGANLAINKAMAIRKYVTYNTKENRLTKYMLEMTARRLEQFKVQYTRIGRDIDATVIKKLDAMIAGINRRCHTGFLNEVSSEATNVIMSLVFGMAPGYRQLYRCFLLLHHGLTLTGSVFSVSCSSGQIGITDLPFPK